MHRLAFPSLDDVPLTKETFFRVLAAAPTDFAAELEDIVAEHVDFYLDAMPTEAGAWEEVLTNGTGGEVADFLCANLDRLLDSVAPGIEFVVTEVHDMDDMSDNPPATHVRRTTVSQDCAPRGRAF